MKYVLVGTQLSRVFRHVIAGTPKDCLCRRRADFLDIMGPDWCRDNIKYAVKWLEEEADQRKLFESAELRARMEKYVNRSIRRLYPWMPFRRLIARRIVSAEGASRRILIKRFILLMIKRAERKK